MRASIGSICLLVAMLVSSASQAQVTLYVTPTNQDGRILTSGSPLNPGDVLTLDIRAENDGTPLFALEVAATDYAPNGLAFAGGSSVPQVFAPFCSPTQCFDGLSSFLSSNQPPFEVFIYPGGPAVKPFFHIQTQPTTATGALDLGVDGNAGGPQARVVFDVVGGPGIFVPDATIRIGTPLEYDGLVGVAVPGGFEFGSSTTIWIVPEPGTGLLLALGLLGLASPGRRSGADPQHRSNVG